MDDLGVIFVTIHSILRACAVNMVHLDGGCMAAFLFDHTINLQLRSTYFFV